MKFYLTQLERSLKVRVFTYFFSIAFKAPQALRFFFNIFSDEYETRRIQKTRKENLIKTFRVLCVHFVVMNHVIFSAQLLSQKIC